MPNLLRNGRKKIRQTLAAVSPTFFLSYMMLMPLTLTNDHTKVEPWNSLMKTVTPKFLKQPPPPPPPFFLSVKNKMPKKKKKKKMENSRVRKKVHNM